MLADIIFYGHYGSRIAHKSSMDTNPTDLVNLQMVLATSSMNHEYTRKAFEKTHSFARKQELLVKMSNLKNLYFAARNQLAIQNPERLESIERELSFQKQSVLSEYGMH